MRSPEPCGGRNFVVDTASDGEDGQHLNDAGSYDAAVLDPGLPDVDGLAVLRAWRAAGRALPVLILAARDGWSKKVEGSKAGADDHLVEPFHRGHAVARLDPAFSRSRVAADRLRSARLRCRARRLDPQWILCRLRVQGLPLWRDAMPRAPAWCSGGIVKRAMVCWDEALQTSCRSRSWRCLGNRDIGLSFRTGLSFVFDTSTLRS